MNNYFCFSQLCFYSDSRLSRVIKIEYFLFLITIIANKFKNQAFLSIKIPLG